MAVINALREKYASGVNTFSFTPRAGTAAIIYLIAIKASTADFAKITAMNTTIGIFEIGDGIRNHLTYPTSWNNSTNLMEFLKEKEIETEIPVAEGEVFSIETTNNIDNLIVRYREVEPGDVKAGMPNYPGSAEQLKLLYGTNVADITASGYARLDKSLNPTEMHNWPFEETACPFEKIAIAGIGILDVQENVYDSADHISQTEKTRFWKGTKQLFTEGQDGFTTTGTGAASGSSNVVFGSGMKELPYTPNRATGNMFMFTEPLEFVRGDEFAVEEYCTIASSGKITAGNLRCVLIGKTGK